MVISIASQKGGTGKTTTSISLAAGLARKGKKVLLIEIESQANYSKVLLPDYQTITKDQPEERLKRELDKIKHAYEYVFIDSPPALSWLTLNAFTASDKVIVVVSPGYFELDSIVQLNKTIAEVQEYFNPSLQLAGMLFTMSDPTINTSNSLNILRQMYGASLLETIIPRNTDLRDAHFQKQDIFGFNPHAKGAAAYEKLIQELFL